LTYDFAPVTLRAIDLGDRGKFEAALGDYFEVMFPTDWPEEECYDFDWRALRDVAFPFQPLTFT
jgi:hypothetical protein